VSTSSRWAPPRIPFDFCFASLSSDFAAPVCVGLDDPPSDIIVATFRCFSCRVHTPSFLPDSYLTSFPSSIVFSLFVGFFCRALFLNLLLVFLFAPTGAPEVFAPPTHHTLRFRFRGRRFFLATYSLGGDTPPRCIKH